MYMDRVIEVSRAQNGFVVSANIPLKPDAKKSEKMICCGGSTNRQYVCKDASEVADIIEDLMPLLDLEFKTEDEFDKAFTEATGAAEEKGEM